MVMKTEEIACPDGDDVEVRATELWGMIYSHHPEAQQLYTKREGGKVIIGYMCD